MAVTLGESAREAYLVVSDDPGLALVPAILATGFDPRNQPEALGLIVGRQASALRRLDGRNPLLIFGAQVGDSVRVQSLVPPPEAAPRQISSTVTTISTDGEIATALPRSEAEGAGLVRGITGQLSLNGVPLRFRVIDVPDYDSAPAADLFAFYRTPAEAVIVPNQPAVETLHLVAPPAQRRTLDPRTAYNLAPGAALRLEYAGFDYTAVPAGAVLGAEEGGQALRLELPA
ncbi:MAG: hypothetical protein HC915_20530, partial [Anaerolineae bacterium]|nr:hypothetical protein [Anaerolineae bacterium]